MKQKPENLSGSRSNSETSVFEEKILKTIDPEEVVEFLQALIRERSDHPPGDCRGVINVVKEKLSSTQIKGQVFSRQEHQPSLLAAYPANADGPKLLFHAHGDTVPAGEEGRWQNPPYEGVIQEGRIYGRGAGDDKGSVAAQVIALVTLARANVDLRGQLQVAVVADEESGGINGTHWLRETGILRPNALVVGEQTNNHIAIAERVACGIDLTVFGKSAHGAMPWAGENAVLKAAGALSWLRKHYFPKLAGKRHPYLPPATLNIGKIRGGIQWSIVPEICKIEMDRRLLPGETREMAMAELQDALETYKQAVEPFEYELFSTGEVAGNIDTPPDEPMVSMAQKALEDLINTARPLTGYAQTSDGRWFARDGIPIILFGPGDPAMAHSTDEFIEIEQLIEATRFLTLFGLRYLTE